MKNVTILFCILIVFLFNIDPISAKNKKKNQGKSEGTYSFIGKSEHLFGPKINKDELKGKVVFYLYWDVHEADFKELKEILRLLPELQEKYRGNDRFAVISSIPRSSVHLMERQVLWERAWFPVYKECKIPDAPIPGNAPFYAVLFDHNGKIFSKGKPGIIYSDVKEPLEAAPHPILGGIKVKFCQKEAEKLESGKNLSLTLKTLEKLSTEEGEKGIEAKKLIDSANKFLNAKK